MKPAQRWKELLAEKGLGVMRRDDLDSLVDDHEPHQLGWAMERYAKTTPYPNRRDFSDWLGRQELPEEVVCAAYLSGEPALIRIADTIETLQGAWFPGPETEEEIQELRERLGKVLL